MEFSSLYLFQLQPSLPQFVFDFDRFAEELVLLPDSIMLLFAYLDSQAFRELPSSLELGLIGEFLLLLKCLLRSV